MNNKILVTGATGNIGTEIVSLLKKEGADFVAGIHNRTIKDVKSIKIDYANLNSLKEAMSDISTLFLLLPSHKEMVQWGRNIIQAAKESGVNHIVHLSSSLAKFNSSLNIIKLFRLTNEDVKNSGINYTITASQLFMNNFAIYYKEAYKQGAISLPISKGEMGLVDLRDVACVNVKVLMNPSKYLSQTLTITGGQNLSYAKAIDIMNRLLKKESKFVLVSDEEGIKAMKQKGFSNFLVDLTISLDHAIVQGYAKEVTNSVEKITGKKPISFEKFVLDNKEAWI